MGSTLFEALGHAHCRAHHDLNEHAMAKTMQTKRPNENGNDVHSSIQSTALFIMPQDTSCSRVFSKPYPLAGLLRLRTRIKKEATKTLAKAIADHLAATSEVGTANESLTKIEHQLHQIRNMSVENDSHERQSGLTCTYAKRAQTYLIKLEDNAQNARRRLNAATERLASATCTVESARTALASACVELSLVESHYQKWSSDEQISAWKRAEAELDDVVLAKNWQKI